MDIDLSVLIEISTGIKLQDKYLEIFIYQYLFKVLDMIVQKDTHQQIRDAFLIEISISIEPQELCKSCWKMSLTLGP